MNIMKPSDKNSGFGNFSRDLHQISNCSRGKIDSLLEINWLKFDSSDMFVSGNIIILKCFNTQELIPNRNKKNNLRNF